MKFSGRLLSKVQLKKLSVSWMTKKEDEVLLTSYWNEDCNEFIRKIKIRISAKKFKI